MAVNYTHYCKIGEINGGIPVFIGLAIVDNVMCAIKQKIIELYGDLDTKDWPMTTNSGKEWVPIDFMLSMCMNPIKSAGLTTANLIEYKCTQAKLFNILADLLEAHVDEIKRKQRLLQQEYDTLHTAEKYQEQLAAKFASIQHDIENNLGKQVEIMEIISRLAN